MARDLITVRLSSTGLAQVDQLATETNTNRSAAIRALLAEALKTDSVVKEARQRLAALAE